MNDTVVRTSGDQTIGGAKTFTSPIKIQGSGKDTQLTSSSIVYYVGTSSNALSFPQKTGTIALTSDIPSSLSLEDDILDGSANRYSPYAADTATATWVNTAANAGKFYLGTNSPKQNTQLNYNGRLCANGISSAADVSALSGTIMGLTIVGASGNIGYAISNAGLSKYIAGINTTVTIGKAGVIAVVDDIPTDYVVKNTAITGATKCKITYDAKGLVTAGADLSASDIPALAISKITGLQTALDGKESTGNKVQTFTSTSDDATHYPSITAVRDFVNSSIEANAARYITSDTAGNSFATKAALTGATTYYYAGKSVTLTKNDYAVVASDETHDNATTRYLYTVNDQGTGSWSYQYVINNKPFTDAQMKAINSGITDTKVSTYDGYAAQIAGKQPKFTDGSATILPLVIMK